MKWPCTRFGARRRQLRQLCMALVVAACSARAEILPPLRVVPPAETATLRVWAYAPMAPVVERWREELCRSQPAIRVEVKACGSDVAMAGLYAGRADIALLGREATASELKAFEWVFRHPPLRIEIMNGSLSRAGHSPALVVCAHSENPLAQLTLAELDAIFSAAPGRGAPQPIRTWGQLGLGGEWAARPIRLYSFDTESGTGRFFREKVLRGGRHLNWESLAEFADTEPLALTSHDAAAKIIAALVRDPRGLAVTSGAIDDTRVKTIPLAASAGAPAVAATQASVIERTYPLARVAFAYVKRRPGETLDPVVAEFLRHALSLEGQRAIETTGNYLPLSAKTAREARRQLE